MIVYMKDKLRIDIDEHKIRIGINESDDEYYPDFRVQVLSNEEAKELCETLLQNIKN
mgnify:CR=1 FL=1